MTSVRNFPRGTFLAGLSYSLYCRIGATILGAYDRPVKEKFTFRHDSNSGLLDQTYGIQGITEIMEILEVMEALEVLEVLEVLEGPLSQCGQHFA